MKQSMNTVVSSERYGRPPHLRLQHFPCAHKRDKREIKINVADGSHGTVLVLWPFTARTFYACTQARFTTASQSPE